MTKLKLRLSLVTILLFFVSASISAADFRSSRPEALGISSERLERLDSVMKSYVDNGQLAGQVILVLRNGRIAYAAENGLRNIES
ncbi:MAG: hypothetical protein VB962_11725, partial [Pseudohongiellaceae bacterium]